MDGKFRGAAIQNWNSPNIHRGLGSAVGVVLQADLLARKLVAAARR